MHLTRFLTTAAVAALLAGAAQAQTPATPATKAPAQPPAATTPAPASTAPGATAAAKVTPAGDIVDTAKASGQFTTFLKAAEATNLTGLLKTNKNLTVFAPTDAAFAALPAGELDKLMLPENKAQLQKLMIYHIVNAPVTSADFKGSTRKAATVNGASVELSGGEKPMVNDATIVQADITASNGILHVVDKVLMPGAASASASGAAASTTAPAAGETPAAVPPSTDAAASPKAATPKTTPPKDKLAALEGSTAQCLAQQTQEMAPSPVPPKEPDAKAAVKDESATPPPAADQAGADAATQEQTPPPAGEPAPPAATEPAPTTQAVPPTTDTTTPPATGAPAATPGVDASTAVPAATATVTMQPVADTPENRAKYKPLSNAGKRSKAKGN